MCSNVPGPPTRKPSLKAPTISASDSRNVATASKTRPAKRKRVPDLALAARIVELIRESGLTQKEWGRKIAGVNEMSASKLANGITRPSEETLINIAKNQRVNQLWTMTGTGEKYMKPGERVHPVAVPKRTGRGVHIGLNEWLEGTRSGRGTTSDEREYLRAQPLPTERDDDLYEKLLAVYREMRERGGKN